MREPDWAALSDLQFLLYNRIADSLNAAMSAIALSDMPEAQDRPAGFWKSRATTKVGSVLNLFMAWSYLIRYKLGEKIPERALRPFHVNTLLDWLAGQLQLVPPPTIESNPMLQANQETVQEALLLLYSVAFTQGANVRLDVETDDNGVWFRVRFSRRGNLPENLEALLSSFKDHWRSQDTAFELLTARDFIQLNGYELVLNTTKNLGEFAFMIRTAGKTKAGTASVQLKTEGATPVFPEEIMLQDKSVTPVMPESDATPILTNMIPLNTPVPPQKSIVPPRLSEIRIWPSVGVPAPIPGADGSSKPVEPPDKTLHIDDTRINKATPVVPLTALIGQRPEALKSDGPKPSDPEHDTVIVTVKLPSPQLPKILDATTPPPAGPIEREAAEKSPAGEPESPQEPGEPGANPLEGKA